MEGIPQVVTLLKFGTDFENKMYVIFIELFIELLPVFKRNNSCKHIMMLRIDIHHYVP